jgi:peptide/nickel transport system permease protein
LVSYVIKRLLVLPIILLAISLGVFSLLYLAPGSVEQALVGARPSSPALLQELRHQYHLDQPFLTQYWIWLRGALRFDFGDSIQTGEPVRTVILRRMTITLFLGAYAFVIAMTGGVLLGAAAAVKRRTSIDRTLGGVSVVAASAPAFATGLLLLYVFGVFLGWFPVFGQGAGFTDRLWHLALPAIALALTAMALVFKLTRTAMSAALEQDYVAFARARGVGSYEILVKYALRNALIPVVTAGGLILGYMLTGAVLVEVTFGLPGIGSLLVDSVSFHDVPVVQGIAMVLATIIVVVNLLTDLLYVFIDPRVRVGSYGQ